MTTPAAWVEAWRLEPFELQGDRQEARDGLVAVARLLQLRLA